MRAHAGTSCEGGRHCGAPVAEPDWANTQTDLAAFQGFTQLSRTEAIKEAQEGCDDRSKAEAKWAVMKPEERREGEEGDTITPNPGYEIQKNGGLADFWYLDDGELLCVPGLVADDLEAFGEANKKVGATMNIFKTQVIYYASPAEMLQNEASWNLARVRQLAAVTDAPHPGLTLGWAGPGQTSGCHGHEEQACCSLRPADRAPAERQ